MRVELPGWIKELERSERTSYIENKEEWFGSTARKKLHRYLGYARVEEYQNINGCALHIYICPDGTIYKENVQARRQGNVDTVSFLVLEKGSFENWDWLEESVWSQREMDAYMVYMNLLSL